MNNYDGKEQLKTLSKIIFRHVNDGKPREERVRVEDGMSLLAPVWSGMERQSETKFSFPLSADNLIIEASCCCYYHWVYRSDITVPLVIHFELFNGYIKKLDEV